MSGIKQELPSAEVDHKDVLLQRMRDLEKETLIQQTVFKKEITERDQVISGHEKEMTELYRKLDSLVERFENVLADKESVRTKDEEIRSLKDLLKTANEQVEKQKTEVSTLTERVERQDRDLLADKESVRTKEEEIRSLKDLLKMADEKLEKRLEQMMQMKTEACSFHQQLTQLVADVEVNKTEQMENVLTVFESVRLKMSSFTELMDHIKHVGTLKCNETSVEEKTDIPVYLSRLQRLYQQMTVKLSAKSVAAELFQNDVLSLGELQKVQFSQTPVEAAEYLLTRLLAIQNPVEYICFLNALKATNQEHIYLWLTYDDYDIDSQHSGLIRQNYTYLVQNLSPRESGLIDLLFQRGVVDDREKQSLSIDDGAVCQAERLLSVLSQKPIEKFEQFLVALDETGQSHIACELRRYQQSVESSVYPVADIFVPVKGLSFGTANNVAHVIAPREDRKGNVRLTVHGDELFIVRREPKGLIEVYSANNFTFKHNIKVKELERSKCRGLTACDSNNCLYVSYWRGGFGGYIARVELTGDNNVLEWKVKGDYVLRGLSVNSEHNLIVACGDWLGRRPNKLIEYTTRGELVCEILLQDDIKSRQHAIQLNSCQYLISHGIYDDSLHGVCIVDANGRVLLSYGNKRDAECEQLNNPYHLAVDKNGFIFVADCGNNRIVVLDSKLKWSRDLQIDGGSVVKQPRSLYLDEKRNLLFVGEGNDDASRVVIITV